MKTKLTRPVRRLLSAAILVSLLLGACSRPTPAAPTPDLSLVQTFAVATFSIGLTQTALVQPTATETPTPSPSPSATPSPTPSATAALVVLPTSSCTVLTFISDVTIPDNTKMAPGEKFTKTWRVKNTGTCDWEEGFQVKFFSGSSMSGKTYTLPTAIGPGKQIDISIEMTAPANTGTYTGNWRMADDAGQFFGDSFYVMILVTEDSGATPAASATTAAPSQTPTLTPTSTETSG